MIDLIKRHSGKLTAASAAVVMSTSLLIIPWEGLSLKTYRDPIGILTYCYGETRDAVAGRTYKLDQCRTILGARVEGFEDSVKVCLPGYSKLPLEVQAAVLSVTYNVDTRTMCKSTMFRKLSQGDLIGACGELSKFNRAGGKVLTGLVNRRASEKAVCLRGVK
jgi:lysozyme